ncbi:ABC transporter ATP-binding protein [Crossiella equi]|uniref:ABC transporter ATP-binding protein n=1 Tax=Crossiella equi TaxID=130796 RepID=UPI000A3A49FB|nr:ABC transporter ATP-binding protein [Crossiella equi]
MNQIVDPVRPQSQPAVRAVDVTKVYGEANAEVHALRGVDVEFGAGEFTAIMGPSGSGKSTLLHCLAGLDVVTSGSVWLGRQRITGMSDAELTRLRRDHIGFIFQAFNLLPTLTARENILLPLEVSGRPVDHGLFDRVVRRVKLTDRLGHRPGELSGGQQQRVAVARALVSRPEVVFADEPTGNLDSGTGTDLLDYLRISVREFGQTIVMVTHDAHAASFADRVVFVRDGQFVHELRNPTADLVLDTMKKLEG